MNAFGGETPQWPDGPGPRVFGYLKPFPALVDLLNSLRARGVPTLVYSDGIKDDVRKRFDSDRLRFVTKRMDPALIARQCDLAILNGTHGTTCDMLLAGKPMLQIPLYGEQEMTADAVCRIGAGEYLRPRSGREEIDLALDKLLANDSYRRAATAFAARHQDFDPIQQREDMVNRALALLPFSRSKHPQAANSPFSRVEVTT